MAYPVELEKGPAVSPKYMEWFHVVDFDDEDERVMLGKRFHSTVTSLEDDQAVRMEDLHKFGSLYQNAPLLSQMMASMANPMPSRIITNVTQSIVDTLVAKQVVNSSKATFDVDDGDWEAHLKADMLDKFTFGEFYRLKVYELHEQGLRDCFWSGDGWIKYTARNGKVYAERVFPLEMRIDPINAVSGPPRELYQIRYIGRSVAAATYPDFAEYIYSMPSCQPPYEYPPPKNDELVRLCEGWHLPGSDDPDADRPGSRGAYMFACNDCVLDLKEWKRERFPFVRMPYSRDIAGGYSIGLVQQLAPQQLELNKLKRRKLQGLHLNAVPRTLMQAGTTITPDFNTSLGQTYTWTGSKPETIISPSVAPEIVSEEQNIINQMYQLAGISPLERGSDMPSRMDSRPGMREYMAAADEKHALPSLTWNRSFLEAAVQIIDVARDIVEERGEYSAFGAAKNFTVKIPFSECNLEDERFRIKLQNTNLLPTTPTGRRLVILDLMKTPFFAANPQMLFQAIADDHPDVSEMLQDATVGKRLVEKQLYMITVKRKYFAPDEHQDVQYAKGKANDTVQQMLIRSNGGFDEDGKAIGDVNKIIAMLDKYMAACDDISAKTQQAAMEEQQAQQAAMGPPAGALPPGGMNAGAGQPGPVGPPITGAVPGSGPGGGHPVGQ